MVCQSDILSACVRSRECAPCLGVHMQTRLGRVGSVPECTGSGPAPEASSTLFAGAEAGRGVTMVSQELQQRYGPTCVPPPSELWPEYCCALQQAFEDAFGVQLVLPDEWPQHYRAHPAL